MTRAAEGLEALARTCGLPARAVETPAPPESFDSESPEAQTRWLGTAAAKLGLEIEPIEAAYGDVDGLIRRAAPALLQVRIGDGVRLLVLRAATRSTASVVAPDLSIKRLPIGLVRAALREPLDARLASETERLLEEAEVTSARRARVRAAILDERLAAASVGSGWLVRLPCGAGIREQASSARLWSRLAALLAAHASAYALWILSWWILGRTALAGRLDHGWLIAWALLLITLVPLELAVTWLQGRLSIDAGALLKRRLLQGALRLEPEEIRHEGAGRLLGRVIEAEAIEALALSGGFLALMAALELAMSALILAAAAPWLPVLLVICAAVNAVAGWRFFARRQAWTRNRLTMTHDLVERMVGHRTVLAQKAREAWHEGEDQALERYLADSRQMDRAAVWLMAVAPRAWLLAGVVGLSFVFASGAATTNTLAVALGGTLLAYRSFRRLAFGVSDLAGAAIAWTEVAPVFHAAARPQAIGSPAFALARTNRGAMEREAVGADLGRPTGAEQAPPLRPSRGADPGASASADPRPLLDAHALTFRYRDRGRPVLRECDLQIRRGERLLLQGPSGGGKSTLTSLLTGLRVPTSGLLLLDGMDRQTLGVDGWHRRSVSVPQFHENHVFMGTFAFNLLMGGEWPPRPEDFGRAEHVCRDLGLGELLERMPAGLLQQVGETGWQLSHGERSRLFIARALLQDADFVVLDESFAQLDPESLQRAMRCVLDRARTVMVIAHP